MESKNTVIQLERPDIRVVEFHIVGTASLIVHKWSEKAKKEMLDKQMKKAKTGREVRDPERDFRDSLYVLEEHKYGFPSIAFKAAMVRAGTYAEMKMTYLRGAFHINGEFVEIQGKPVIREDMVRVGMGTADFRYRGEFKNWKAILQITYNAKAISVEQLSNLIMVAGFSVGVGEWRPEKDGQHGTFALQEN